MTVEEAIQQANAGDIETMVILGDYYGQNKDYDNALVWYRKAAELGDLNAMYKTFMVDGMCLHTGIIVSPSEEDDEHFREIDHYAGILKNHPQFQIEPNYSECKYAYAESLYRRDEHGALLSLTQDETQPRFGIMYALALLAIGGSRSNDDEISRYYEAACNVIQVILQSNYTPQDTHHEQLFFVKALSTYSNVIRIGLDKSPDIPASYKILAAQMDRLTNEDAKSLLSDLLSHYRVKKGLFGTSITYVD